MFGFKTPRFLSARDPHSVYAVVGLCCVLALLGCGTRQPPHNESGPPAAISSMPGSNDPAWLTSREKLPPPDMDRLDYDARERSLTLYELPGRDSWMVQLPNEQGRTVGSHYHLPEGVDPRQALVYYARAGVKVSMPVTVAQIEAGRMTQPSLSIGGN